MKRSGPKWLVPESSNGSHDTRTAMERVRGAQQPCTRPTMGRVRRKCGAIERQPQHTGQGGPCEGALQPSTRTAMGRVRRTNGTTKRQPQHTNRDGTCEGARQLHKMNVKRSGVRTVFAFGALEPNAYGKGIESEPQPTHNTHTPRHPACNERSVL